MKKIMITALTACACTQVALSLDYDNADFQICSKSQPAGLYPPCPNCRLAAENPTLRRHVEAVRAADAKANAEWDAVTSAEGVAQLRACLRRDFVKSIGGLPGRTPLNVRTAGVVRRAGYRVEKLLFESQPKHFVTANLYLPDGASAGNRVPGLLVPCGHAAEGKLYPKYRRLCELAVRAGMAALVYDPVDQGERWQGDGPCSPVGGHVCTGLRAHLLGWNMARFRVWDGLRALDCLTERPEVDAARIGVAGQSGGGTLSAYLYFLDDRIAAAAPAGFVTSASRLAEHWGPQDCEQLVQGQLAIGLNHTALLAARAPSPACLVLAEQDAFPVDGSLDTFAHLKALYWRLGCEDRIAKTSTPGLHGYCEASMRATVDFMRRWLRAGGTAAAEDGAEVPAAELQVVPAGRVARLPGYRSTYDMLRDELAAAERDRQPLTREIVRAATGIDVTVTEAPDEDFSFKGRTAYWTRFHAPEAEIAALDAWLGTSFVRERAEAMIAKARAYGKAHGKPMPLAVSGTDAVAAAHAKYLVPELFGPLEISDPPPSWKAALLDEHVQLPIETLVYGALRHYDWTDLRAAVAKDRPWVSAEEQAAMARPPYDIDFLAGTPETDALRFWLDKAKTKSIDINYDEAKAGELGKDYTLPDLMAFADGRKVRTAADWAARRKEILGIFEREMYGVMPPKPAALEVEVVSDELSEDRFSRRRVYRTWFRKDRSGPHIDWFAVVPTHARGRVPVVLHLNYDGIATVAKGRTNHYELPLGMMVARGYAFLSAHYRQVTADPKTDEEFRNVFDGVYELWGRRDPKRTDNTGTLMAWAWALCRGLDLAERIPEIDAKRNVLIGSSRLGKAALLAGAFDERVAVTVPNQTGAVGVQVMRRNYGETLEAQKLMFPHWYCPAAWKYVGCPEKQPFDQHMLLACVAPRALLLECYHKRWFDPKGEFVAAVAASPAWELLGARGLACGETMPEPYDDAAVRPPFGYVRRTECHGLSPYDWKWALDFADKVWRDRRP